MSTVVGGHHLLPKNLELESLSVETAHVSIWAGSGARRTVCLTATGWRTLRTAAPMWPTPITWTPTPAKWRRSTPATIAPTANVIANFTEEMDASTTDGDPSTINGTTLKLVKLNANGTRVTATVTYDAATKKAILDPSSDLSLGRTCKATVTSGAQDLAGNALDQKPNIAGNQSKSWKLTVVQ
jgi:hypothetical protein